MNEDSLNNNWAASTINAPDFDNGKNKVKAISNASQALQIARKLRDNDRQRDLRRARVLGAFNGEPPYSDKALIEKAQSYRYNVSFGFLEGVVGRAVVPYNDLTINIGDLTEIEANLPDAKRSIVQEEFANTIKKWGRWTKFISRLNQDLVLNGYNTAIYPSEYDPFPVFVAQKDGYVDDGSPNDVNDLELFVWKKSYLLHELYSRIENEDVAEKAGWNVDNVKQALMQATPESIWNKGNVVAGQWTAVESAIRGGSLWSSVVGARMVDTYHVFATELSSGKVTQYIVLDYQSIDTDSVNVEGANVELFKKEERFDSMQEFLVYFDLETGDGTWHGSKGVGQRAFNTHVAIDKLRCSALDQAFVSGLTLLQPGDQTSQEDFTLTVVGPFAVIPPSITIAPATLPAVSATTFQVDSLLSATSEQRIGDVVPTNQSLVQNQPKTATEAKIAAGRQQLITQGNLKRYIDPISAVLSIMIRRLLKKNSPNPYAKYFQETLKARGLTDEDLARIRGARNTGRIDDVLGNTASNTQVIFAEFRGDPEIDQTELKRRRISSVLDSEAADELIISDKDRTREIEAMRAQEIEDTTIMSGSPVEVSPRDNHEAHLAELFKRIGTMIQQAAQNPDPAMIPVLKALTQHGVDHLRFLDQDKTKKQAAKDAESKLKDASDAIKMMEASAKKIAEAHINEAAKLAKTPEEFQQIQQAKAQLNQQPTQ